MGSEMCIRDSNTAGLDQHGINRIHSLLSAEPIVVDLNTITSVAGPAVVR